MKPEIDADVIDLLIAVGALQILSYSRSSGGISSLEDVVSGRFRERRKSTVTADLLGVSLEGGFDPPPGRWRRSKLVESEVIRIALADALDEAWLELPRRVKLEVILIIRRQP